MSTIDAFLLTGDFKGVPIMRLDQRLTAHQPWHLLPHVGDNVVIDHTKYCCQPIDHIGGDLQTISTHIIALTSSLN